MPPFGALRGLEQLASGSAGDGEYAGMGDAPLDRDGIKMFLDPVDRAHVPDLMPRLGLADQHLGRQQIAHTLAAELLGQSAVVEVGGDARPQTLGLEPGAQLLPDGGVLAGHQQRRAV